MQAETAAEQDEDKQDDEYKTHVGSPDILFVMIIWDFCRRFSSPVKIALFPSYRNKNSMPVKSGHRGYRAQQ
jgi:hypothetical protein